MRIPIRVRLAVASCAIFLVVIAALEVVAYFSVREAIRSIVDHELQSRLAGLDDHLARHLNRLPWPTLRDSLNVHPAFEPNLLRITDSGGGVIFEGEGLRGVSVPLPVPDGPITTIGAGSRALRVIAIARNIDGKTYGLILGTDLSFSVKILGRLWVLILVSLPLVLLIAGGAGSWMSGRAMSSVSDIIGAARAIDSSRLSDRIAVPQTADEIQQLAETMNGMLARIEASFDRVRQFLANASHELRTPIAIIRANAEVALLAEEGPGDDLRDTLRRILREAERDSALLEDMLHLARIDAGTLLDRRLREPVDLNDSLAQACASIRPVAEGRGLTLRLTLSPTVLTVEADEEQLRRLWLILLDNACKYTMPGGAIHAGVDSPSGGQCRVFVQDSGIGIAHQHRDRIFERFFRVDRARSRSLGGTGLGLSIAQHIAAAHDASLNLDSELGRGSLFSVTFTAVVRKSFASATTGLWLNSAAFAVPANGTWGDLGRDVLRAPRVVQFDTALSKKWRLTEKFGLECGLQAFNIFNHPLLAAPGANISSTSSFGRITAPLNTSPIGEGTPRRIQVFMRISF